MIPRFSSFYQLIVLSYVFCCAVFNDVVENFHDFYHEELGETVAETHQCLYYVIAADFFQIVGLKIKI